VAEQYSTTSISHTEHIMKLFTMLLSCRGQFQSWNFFLHECYICRSKTFDQKLSGRCSMALRCFTGSEKDGKIWRNQV